MEGARSVRVGLIDADLEECAIVVEFTVEASLIGPPPEEQRYERSEKGQSETKGATALQATFRARQSRLAAKHQAKKRLDSTAQRLLGDAAFQGMVHSCVEGSIFNLIQEALHNEFELNAAPVQRLLPT